MAVLDFHQCFFYITWKQRTYEISKKIRLNVLFDIFSDCVLIHILNGWLGRGRGRRKFFKHEITRAFSHEFLVRSFKLRK